MLACKIMKQMTLRRLCRRPTFFCPDAIYTSNVNAAGRNVGADEEARFAILKLLKVFPPLWHAAVAVHAHAGVLVDHGLCPAACRSQ